MFVVLLLLFLVVPIVELAVIVAVADQIGIFATIGALILFSVCGAWLVKREGLGVLRRVQDQLGRGQVPTTELVDGLLVLVAGALLLFPGFISDTLGLLLLLPPVRAVVRLVLLRRFAKRITTAFSPDGSGSFAGPFGGGYVTGRVFTGSSTYDRHGSGVVDVHEVDAHDRDDRGGEPPRLGRS